MKNHGIVDILDDYVMEKLMNLDGFVWVTMLNLIALGKLMYPGSTLSLLM